MQLLLSKISDWNTFDVFQLDACSHGKPLQLVTLRLLETLGMVERLQLDVTALAAFLAAAEAQYCAQPYHNSTHAADVVQALGYMMTVDEWADALEECELLALIIGAAVHDLGHPGVNNDFHMRTNSEAAQAFSCRGSINENTHAALALSLLPPPPLVQLKLNNTNTPTDNTTTDTSTTINDNFLTAALGEEKAAAFREILKDLILSTDMAHHNDVIDAVTAALQQYGSSLSAWPVDSRRAAMRMFLHSADISNPARPLEQCAEWGRRVQEELYGQGDRERELGLVLTPACDRGTTCPNRSQAAFIKHVMRPSFCALEPLAPVFVRSVTPHIAASLQYWEGMAEGPPSPVKEPGVGSAAGSLRRRSEIITYLAP